MQLFHEREMREAWSIFCGLNKVFNEFIAEVHA